MSPHLRLTRQAGLVAVAALLSSATLGAALLPALRPAAPAIPDSGGSPHSNGTAMPLRPDTAVVVLPRVFIVAHRSLSVATPSVARRTTLSI